MKANSRRRVLISSVAMLLVAIVALGTATYAWFTTSTTTTASGLNVKTVKSSEPVISNDSRVWDQTIDYGVDGLTLRPASTANGVNWWSGSAEKKTGFAIKDGDKFASVTGNAAYYFENELNVANKGMAAVEGVTITVSGLTNNYARMAIVEINPDTKAITGTFTASVFDKDGETYDAVSGEAKTATTPIEAKNTISVNVGDLAGKDEDKANDPNAIGEAKYYKLLVWFEGQDQQCVDTNAGQAIGDIVITVAGTTATEPVTTVAAG